MKKKFQFICFITATMLSLLFTNANAQHLYFNLGGGYGFNTSSVNSFYLQGPCGYFVGYDETYSSTYYSPGPSTYTRTDKAISGGFGSGLNLQGIIGYSFSEHFGGELGLSYLSGNSIESSYSGSSYSNYTTDTWHRFSSAEAKLASEARVRLIPAIKISGTPSGFTPYLKVGMLIGLGGTMTFNYDDNY
ncbi:MAG: hypothetical protein JJE25_08570, partial [Bacteroidia bacterium]|nr:hypothetical protein [Bacteroidia bacterium]